MANGKAEVAGDVEDLTQVTVARIFKYRINEVFRGSIESGRVASSLIN